MTLIRKSKLDSKEIHRKRVIRELLDGKLDVTVAAEQLKVSVRQVYRLVTKVKKSGLDEVIHGNKGRTPANKIAQEKWEQIFNLVKEEYSSLSIYQLQKALANNHQIIIGRESLRKKLRIKKRLEPVNDENSNSFDNHRVDKKT